METNESSSSSTKRYHFLPFNFNENLALSIPLKKMRETQRKVHLVLFPPYIQKC